MSTDTSDAVTKLTRSILIPRDVMDSSWVDVWPATVQSVIEEFRTYADEHGLDIGAWDLKVEVSDRWFITTCDDRGTITELLVDETAARAHLFGHAAGIGPLPRPNMLHAYFCTVEYGRG